MLVIDSSVLVDALGGDKDRAARARAAILGDALYAPSHLDIEVLSAWRRHLRQGRISPSRASEGVTYLNALPITRVPHEPLLDRIWEMRENFTMPDAAYIALAEQFGAALITCDRRLANAPGSRCEIRVVE